MFWVSQSLSRRCVLLNLLLLSCDILQAYFVLLRSALLHFADLAFFSKLKVCGNLALSKSVGIIFPMVFAHIMSVSHYGTFCNISNFLLLLYLLWWPVICDVTIEKRL